MYWHIDADIISLIIMVALYIYSERLLVHAIKTDQDKWFLVCFRIGIIIAVIDIAASIIMEMPTPRALYHIIMSAYMISIEDVIIAWFFYASTMLYDKDDVKMKRLSFCLTAPYIAYSLVIVTNPWTGLIYSLDNNMVYSRGPWFPLMVIFYGVYAAALLILIMIRRKHIGVKYSAFVLFSTPVILALSIVVQLLNPGWLMLIPGYTICLLIAFLFLQDREARERLLLMQSLSTAALTDRLTGLFNRAGMEMMVRNIQSMNSGKTCLCLVADLDDLKGVNDTLGHLEGDRALVLFAEKLRSHFRSSDLVSRFGGDEFVVYLAGDLSELWVHRTLQSLIDDLSDIKVGENDSFSIHGSVGAAMGTVGNEDFITLCNHADIALYQVKRSGKQNYAIYTSDMEHDLSKHDDIIGNPAP